MKRTRIVDVVRGDLGGQDVCVKGWVRTFRNNQFIALNDGSCLESDPGSCR